MFITKKRSRRAGLATLAAAALAAGCSGAPAASASSGGTKHYSYGGVSYDYPSSWKTTHYKDNSIYADSIAFTSNQAMHNPCSKSNVHGKCLFPVTALNKAGAILEWSYDYLPSWDLGIEQGSLTTVDGRQAKVDIEKPGLCFQIKGTETIDVSVTDPTANHYFSLIACLRGPLNKTTVNGFNKVLHSTKFTK
jgi:hypothetical protein